MVEEKLHEKGKVRRHRTQRYVSFEKSNLTINLGSRGVIDTVFIRPSSNTSLPMGLLWSHTRRDVRHLLGSPSFSRERQKGCIGGPGDVFDFPSMTLAIDFSFDDDGIDMACCMMREVAPGRDERERGVGSRRRGI